MGRRERLKREAAARREGKRKGPGPSGGAHLELRDGRRPMAGRSSPSPEWRGGAALTECMKSLPPFSERKKRRAVVNSDGYLGGEKKRERGRGFNYSGFGRRRSSLFFPYERLIHYCLQMF